MSNELQARAWLHQLHGELEERGRRMDEYDDFYEGEHPLPFLTKAHNSKMRDEFRQMLKDSQANFCRLVVDAVDERLAVEGFRLSASTDQEADAESWRLWQANGMDSESQTAFVEALVKGVSYISVWAGQTDDDPAAVMTVEDPEETIVGYRPGTNYRVRDAALKTWDDEALEIQRADVYLPDGVWRFQRPLGANDGADVSGSEFNFLEAPSNPVRRLDIMKATKGWVPLAITGMESFIANPWNVVPIVPIRNRPRLGVEGESELTDVVPLQKQINGFLFLLALAGYMGAHRQRWATGLAIDEDADGRPREPYNAAVDRLWVAENAEVKFGEFSQTDLDGYIKAIEQKILHIAVTTRTPRHYLIEQGQSPSGDAIKSAESGLTKKVARKQRPFGEGLEEAMRVARRIAGLGVSPVDSEVVWASPAIRTEAEITDAAMKKWASGLITWQQALEDCGYTQTQIARMLADNGGTPPQPLTAAAQAAAV